jgi:16S rRNA (uracil1498-N3)-methyltransferase
VDQVVVFHAGRSIPVWDEAKGGKMAQRYRSVALAAAKQSHRAWLPEITGPVDRSDAVRLCEGSELCLLADPSGELSLREALPYEPPSSIALIVGPEGGLEEAEIEEFAVSGASRVRLGPQVLRTETAGLVIASVVMFHVGRLD